MARRISKSPLSEPNVPTSVRLPEGLRRRAEMAAVKRGMGLSTIIVHLLEQAFPPDSPIDAPLSKLNLTSSAFDPDGWADHRLEVIAAMRAEVAELIEVLNAEEERAKEDLKDLQY